MILIRKHHINTTLLIQSSVRKINKILLKEFANEAAGLGKKEGTFIKDIPKYLTGSSPSLKLRKIKQKNNP